MMLTMLLAGLATFITSYLNYRTGLNAIWMFGIPVLIAVLGNASARTRLLMSLVLLMCSLLSLMLTAAAFGLGY